MFVYSLYFTDVKPVISLSRSEPSHAFHVTQNESQHFLHWLWGPTWCVRLPIATALLPCVATLHFYQPLCECSCCCLSNFSSAHVSIWNVLSPALCMVRCFHSRPMWIVSAAASMSPSSTHLLIPFLNYSPCMTPLFNLFIHSSII